MRRVLLLILACLTLAACGGSHPDRATLSSSTTATATVNGGSFMGSVAPKGWGAPLVGAQPIAPVGVTGPTHTMFDSVDLSTIPASAFAAAGYTAGLYPTWRELLARFPHARHVSVAISAVYHADCLDVEPLDATPAQAGPWARADMRAGFRRPCLYGDLAEMPAIKASLAHTLGSHWRGRVLLWLAYYTGHPGVVAGYDATQYTDRALGRNLDESTVTNAFLGIVVQPRCYTHRESRAACSSARARVARDAKAVTASARVYTGRRCPMLAQRVTWFSEHLRRYPHTRTVHRRQALAASRRVYRRESCSVFAQRVRWFTHAEAAVRAAN